MTTLVIGAGLVGAQVARLLTEDGERPVLLDHAAQTAAVGQIVDTSKVVMIEGDVLRPLSIVKAIVDHKITSIVHTAAYPLLTLGAQREPYAAINLNIMGTVNVLEAARVSGIKRVVVSSSSVLCSFFDGGEGGGDLMQEEALPRPTTFYAATKQAVESIGLNYARWCGIEFAGLRYGAVFGPWNGAGGGGPSNTVRQALRDAIAGRDVKLPEAAMEWVYSKDAARGTVLALRAKDLGTGVFNITMGSLTQPSDMGSAIIKAVPGAKVRYETPPASALALPNARKLSNPAKAEAVLGYRPEFALDRAIADMAGFMRANPA